MDDAPENIPAAAEHGFFSAVLDRVKAPFAVGAFLGLLAQLLGVNGWAALALVLIGGAGPVVAQWRWRASRWQALVGGGLAAVCLLSILLLASIDARSQTDQGSAPRAGDTGPRVGPPDPRFYLTFDGRLPSREQECMGLRPDHRPQTPFHPAQPHPEKADHTIGDSRTPTGSPNIETINPHRHQPRRWIEAQRRSSRRGRHFRVGPATRPKDGARPTGVGCGMAIRPPRTMH